MKGRWLFCMALILLFLSAGSFGAGDALAQAPDKIIIGGPISFSGKLAKEGEQGLRGTQAAVKWINEVYGGVKIGGKKVPIEYKYYDDESKRELTTSYIERAITVDKVHAVMSPYSSPLVLAGAPVAEKYGVVYINHGGASDRIHEQGFKYAVQCYVPGSRYHVGALDMFKKLDPKLKRLAFVYEDDEFARSVARGAKAHAEKLGYTIVFDRFYPKGATALTPILSDLSATKPDIILGGGHFSDTQLLGKQIADLGIDVKAINLVVGPALPAYGETLGKLAEGIMGPAHWERGAKFSPDVAKKTGMKWIGPTQEEYRKLFKDVSKGVEPDYHGASAASGVFALVLSIEDANSIQSDKVRYALGKLKFMSVYGIWDVDDDTGLQIGHSSIDLQWQGGKKVIVWPEEAATAKPCYPRPTIKDIIAGKTCK